jgi:hypothetical protein
VTGVDLLTSSHERQVEILVGEQRVARTPVRLVLQLTVERARITVDAGRLTRLNPGNGKVVATLSVADQILRERTKALPLPASVPLGGGLRIVRPAQRDETGDGRR